MRISVVGAGSWGTAVSWLLGGKGHEVRLWSREEEIADSINADHRNPMYLKDVVLTESVFATPDIGEALRGAEAVVMVTPSMGVRTTAESMAVGGLAGAAARLREVAQPGDLVLTLGAGNVYQAGDELLRILG